jgi:asparagine synthase (glutamine-hydrolysing)
MSRFCALLSKKQSQNLPRFDLRFNDETFIVSEQIVYSLTQDISGKAEIFTFENLSAVGEITIYNRAEIKKTLAVKNQVSDGELLLRLYAKDGINGFSQIEGMFAVAISDGETLVIARDAIGKRTLFYVQTKNTFAASSSLKFLRKTFASETNLNLSAVVSFLTFAYLPGEETLLENVFELLPAHALKIFPDGKRELTNYYEPLEQLDDSKSIEQHIQNLRQTLETSMLTQLEENEDEIGVFLSGGVDSSLITALATKFRPGKVRTYSISFGEDNPNETAYSGLVAAHCRTKHKVLSFSGKQIAQYLAETISLLDCPVGDPLTVPNFLLAKAAAEDGLRHVFNGEGGDPCFGGPKNLPMLIFALQQENHQSLATTYLSSYRKCYDDLPRLLSPDVQEKLRNAPKLERFVEPFLENTQMNAYLNRLLYVNVRTKLAHHILPKVERITSFWNLEGHSPLADKACVDNAFTIPSQLKLKGTIEKWILKEAVRDLLPTTIIDRPKSGMRVPVQNWLHGALRDLSNELLFGKQLRVRGLFQEKTIRTWLKGEGLIYARQGGKLWLLITLEIWLRNFFDSSD